ncbi:MAG: HAMP domain-containing histidine kinase [Oscillospiraceae bacterium]|nr:HAMP domain-containing histidine kinase [Oscillospiraceae bacterium]
MIRRLRVKFVCINMALVTVMLCVIFGTVLRFTRENLEAKSVNQLNALAMEGPKPPGSYNLPYFIVQTDRWGGTLVTGSGSYQQAADVEALPEILTAALDTGEISGVLPAYQLRFRLAPAPGGRKFVFVDISSEVSTLEGLVQNCILTGCLAFAAFLVISLLLARWAVKPVDRAWQQQRQFVADASHELKTPLTVILTNAELMQDTGDTVRARENILIMARQMRGLVENLLDLARVDNGLAGMEQLDFSRLVSDALLPFEPVFFERGLELSGELAEGIQIQGSPDHLRQVAEILLDNAQKYAVPPGTVTVRLERTGGKSCVLSVSDPGDPLSKTDLQNIFKRFYRADEARSRNGSYGLGLAIAESIVTAHRGKIWAESENGTNTFFVRLPVCREAKP